MWFNDNFQEHYQFQTIVAVRLDNNYYRIQKKILCISLNNLEMGRDIEKRFS